MILKKKLRRFLNSILIIKTSALGDIAHCFSVLEYLSIKCSAASIDWVVEAPHAGLLRAHPLLANLFLINSKTWRKNAFKISTWREMAVFRTQLRMRKYDVAFDLQGNTKSGFILSQVRSQKKVGFGPRTIAEWPNLFFSNQKFDPVPNQNITEDYLAVVAHFFSDFAPSIKKAMASLNVSEETRQRVQQILHHPFLIKGPRVVVCPGSAWPNKQLSYQALLPFLQLVQKQLHCNFLFIWGNAAEYAMASSLQHAFGSLSMVVEKLCLPGLQQLMQQCALVIAMDSLPLHLAGTTTTPTFSIFGASSAHKYKPSGERHGFFQGVCPYGKSFEKRCPVLRTCSTGACIHGVNSHDIYARFCSWWENLESISK